MKVISIPVSLKAHEKSSLEMTEANQDLGGDTPLTLLSSGLTLP